MYSISSILESKDSYTWYGWSISKTPKFVDKVEVFNMAKGFASLVNEGKAAVKFEDADIESDSAIDMKTEEGILG